MKEYGIKLTDVLGATYTRWLSADGVFSVVNGISIDLLQLGSELDEMSLKHAVKHCKAMKNGICYTVLHEDDFKNNKK